MSSDHKVRADRFADYFSTLSDDELAKITEDGFERTKKYYTQFQEAFKNNKCSLCNESLML